MLTFFDAIYQANESEILPLMLDIRLYVNPKAIPSFAMACLSIFVALFAFPHILVATILAVTIASVKDSYNALSLVVVVAKI
jgi:hypothetical protein